MTYQRLAYADQDPATTMTSDCVACDERFVLPHQRVEVPGAALAPVDGARPRASTPSVSEATAHLGARLQLHLD